MSSILLFKQLNFEELRLKLSEFRGVFYMNPFISTALIILVITSGCASIKTKRSMIDKYSQELFDLGFRAQISNSNEKFETIHPASIYDDSALKTISKKELKRLLKYFNVQFALMPDSVHHSENGIDSFYTNRTKIAYLKKHYRKSNQLHFIMQ